MARVAVAQVVVAAPTNTLNTSSTPVTTSSRRPAAAPTRTPARAPPSPVSEVVGHLDLAVTDSSRQQGEPVLHPRRHATPSRSRASTPNRGIRTAPPPPAPCPPPSRAHRARCARPARGSNRTARRAPPGSRRAHGALRRSRPASGGPRSHRLHRGETGRARYRTARSARLEPTALATTKPPPGLNRREGCLPERVQMLRRHLRPAEARTRQQDRSARLQDLTEVDAVRRALAQHRGAGRLIHRGNRGDHGR